MPSMNFLKNSLEKEIKLYNRDKFFRSLEYLTDILAATTVSFTTHYLFSKRYDVALSLAAISSLFIISRITLEQTINDESYKKVI